ncbi:ISXc5-like transposase [Pseudomonas chlororaphis O6]|uniref:ISXc5-like transposase n=1 Tax=Pseudomonas chlororaphis O6 TaxID=1037915 RepID=A0AB33X155_9PSED|nr:ISXc5-like transposase [Pseudomonas chlororaphis O6]
MTCSFLPVGAVDPRLGLLDGAEWLAARPVICRSLGLTIDAGTILEALSAELDAT